MSNSGRAEANTPPSSGPYAYVIQGTSNITKGENPMCSVEIGTVRYSRRLGSHTVAGLKGVTLTFQRNMSTETGLVPVYLLEVKSDQVTYCSTVECLILAIVEGNRAEERKWRRNLRQYQ